MAAADKPLLSMNLNPHIVPSALVLGTIGFIVLLVDDRTRAVFRTHRRSPDLRLGDEQASRLSAYEFAIPLQLATNKWHEEAIRAKRTYELIGVAASAAAPALIWLNALEHPLFEYGLASRFGVACAHVIVAAAMLSVLLAFRHPSHRLVTMRMRAELLRFHLHSHLAGVGPYGGVPPTPSEWLDTAEHWSDTDALVQLRDGERMCLDQARSVVSIASMPDFSVAHAQVYLEERVEHQARYFETRGKQMSAAYRTSAHILLSAVAAATVLGAVSLFYGGAAPVLSSLFTISGGLGVLILGFRAVFGWDAKETLYARQADVLARLEEQLNTGIVNMRANAPGAVLQFRRIAADYEAAMAREACDWALLSRREYYDAGI